MITIYPKVTVRQKGKSLIYPSVIEEFNQRPFKLDSITEHYNVTTPFLMEHGHIHVPNENALSGGMYTCRHIVDFYVNKVVFRIVDDQDAIEIVKLFDRYLNFITQKDLYKNLAQEEIRYIDNVVIIRNKINDYNRMMRRTTEQLYPSKEKPRFSFSRLISSLGG